MKKSLKVVTLLTSVLFAFSIMITSCDLGNSTKKEEEKQKKEEVEDLCKALFSTSDTKVQVYKFELEDGDWIYRTLTKESDTGRNESVNVTFTLTNGKTDLDKEVEITHQVKYTKDIPGSVVDKLEEEGYDHYTDQHWYKKTTDMDKIKEIAAMDIANNSEDLAKYNKFSEFEEAIYTATHYIPENGDSTILTLKTNAEKNKYWWQRVTIGTNNTYLMKDE